MRDPEAFASEQAALGQLWTLLGLTADIPNHNDWFRCAFHHWVYNQDGEALGIPQCKTLFGMSPRQLGVRLREIEIATCGVLIFGRLSRQPPERSAVPSEEAAPPEHPTPLSPLPSGRKDSLEEYLGEAWPILNAMGRAGITPFIQLQ